MINLDLTRALAPHGLHFAPDPSSQQACTIGGNVANNSGGPHCLAYGVTSAHVLAVEVVLPDGSVTVLGGLDPEPAGLDLRGVFVGSEGTLGIATRIAVRLTPNPPAVAHAAARLPDRRRRGRDGERDHRRRHRARRARDDGPAHHRRRSRTSSTPAIPTDAAAVLLVEVDGLPAGVADAVGRVGDDRPRPRRPGGAGGGRRRRAGPAVEGPQVGVRRGRPRRAQLLPARHGRAPHPAGRGAGRGLRHRRAPRPRRDERVPRRRRQPPPAAAVRRPRARGRWSGCTPPATRSCGCRSPPAACCRASTASGSRSAT